MAFHIALLHSITIANDRRLVMADWRAMMESIGLKRPRTLIATGNAVFVSERATVRQLEKRLETAFEQSFGRHIDTIVKTRADWRKLTRSNPFPEQAEGYGDSALIAFAEYWEIRRVLTFPSDAI